MKIIVTFSCILVSFANNCHGQKNDLYRLANSFLELLDKQQQAKAQYPYDSDERYRWHYVPLNDRKGIPISQLNAKQKDAALLLLNVSLSQEAYKKATAIMQLEIVLKALEKRQDSDDYRDPGKYFFTIFGDPNPAKVWGWRLDGHHLSFSFSSEKNKIVSGTPGFMGANPAVVLTGAEKGLEILKEENELAFDLLRALDEDQLKKAVIADRAPGDIITVNSRKAIVEDTIGIRFNQLKAKQQAIFVKLLSIYIHRYTRLFAESMMKEIDDAGMEKLVFAWAGSTENGPGHQRYYRIKGPTIIIEYDNTQNNGNHVHTVVRDLTHDFGGDMLLEHYKQSH